MATNRAREDREERKAAGRVEGLSALLSADTKRGVAAIATFHMPTPSVSAKGPSLTIS
ncbi:MAG: hypothetical protein ACXW30_00420 [Micavibrio sp.]